MNAHISIGGLFFIFFLLDPAKGCINECTCMWKSGKQTVECIGANLIGIPLGLSPETQVLDLTGNLLQLLPSKSFHQVGLVNLQKVYASRCGLLQIAEDALYQLSNLVELDLSSNFLTSIPATALRDTSLLRRLQLSHNPIQRIDNDTFVNLVHLTTLELSNCQIENVEPLAFNNLRSLEYLKLDGNKLRTLPGEIVYPFTTLYALDLHHNPWHCDCRIRYVRVWMIRKNVPISSPPQCEQPTRLRGLTWDTIRIDEFACAPVVTAVNSFVSFNEGQNATLACKIEAVPDATVHWIWRGRLIGNRTLISFGRQLYLIKEHFLTTHKISSLNIYNVMLKDVGRYMCVASNPAGKIAVNLTLTVHPKEKIPEGLSGEEIAGIVIGVLFIFIIIFVIFCLIVLRQKRAFIDKRNSSGFTIYKHFFSFSHSHHDHQKTVVEENNIADGKCNSSNAAELNSESCAYPDVTKKNTMPDFPYSKQASTTADAYLTATTPKSTQGEEDVVVRNEDLELSVYSAAQTEQKTDSDDWESSVMENVAEESFFNNKDGDAYVEDGDDERYDSSSIREYYVGSDFATLKSSMWPLQDSAYKDESYHSYSSPSQSSWKRSSVVLPHQIHHVLSPDARDSPDEGLGDEREYETDILD